jgi:hypothetical protein
MWRCGRSAAQQCCRGGRCACGPSCHWQLCQEPPSRGKRRADRRRRCRGWRDTAQRLCCICSREGRAAARRRAQRGGTATATTANARAGAERHSGGGGQAFDGDERLSSHRGSGVVAADGGERGGGAARLRRCGGNSSLHESSALCGADTEKLRVSHRLASQRQRTCKRRALQRSWCQQRVDHRRKHSIRAAAIAAVASGILASERELNKLLLNVGGLHIQEEGCLHAFVRL